VIHPILARMMLMSWIFGPIHLRSIHRNTIWMDSKTWRRASVIWT
jgi:hypothetical protein